MGHCGRDRTLEMLERDFWWDGVYANVSAWCKNCVQCNAQRGRSGLSAWKRTELYSHPSRVIHFDFVEIGASETDEGLRYILTCICPFSRWVWAVPTMRRTADTVARVMMQSIFCDIAGFPAVINSDQAAEFVG